jgi:hypothetical protein
MALRKIAGLANKRARVLVVGLCAGLLAVLALCLAPFGYSSVCCKCGAIRSTTEWQIRRTEFRVFQWSSETETPVSRTLRATSIVGPHKHDWAFAHGGGNGVRCALGRGHNVIGTVGSVEVAQLIEELSRYGVTRFRDKVLVNLFDDRTSFLVCSLGGQKFSDAQQLKNWIGEQESLFDEHVEAFKK